MLSPATPAAPSPVVERPLAPAFPTMPAGTFTPGAIAPAAPPVHAEALPPAPPLFLIHAPDVASTVTVP